MVNEIAGWFCLAAVGLMLFALAVWLLTTAIMLPLRRKDWSLFRFWLGRKTDKMQKYKMKIVLYMAITALLVVAALLFGCNYLVCSNAEGKLYDDIASTPEAEVGLLLGTAPRTRIGRRPNLFFKYRTDAAEALYKSGKIKTILISGDENSLDGINEVTCMRDSLVARGIPASATLLDGKGVRTLDAVVRATDLYGLHRYLVISQKFHNERALYLAEHLVPGVQDPAGFNAVDVNTDEAFWTTYLREYFARVKMFLDILFGK